MCSLYRLKLCINSLSLRATYSAFVVVIVRFQCANELVNSFQRTWKWFTFYWLKIYWFARMTKWRTNRKLLIDKWWKFITIFLLSIVSYHEKKVTVVRLMELKCKQTGDNNTQNGLIDDEGSRWTWSVGCASAKRPTKKCNRFSSSIGFIGCSVVIVCDANERRFARTRMNSNLFAPVSVIMKMKINLFVLIAWFTCAFVSSIFFVFVRSNRSYVKSCNYK